MKKIEVKIGRGRPMTYETSDDVVVGDSVAVPRPWFLEGSGPGPTHGVVVGIGSEYSGPCLEARKIAKAGGDE